VDPHTHALFVGSRQDEFEMRLEGKTYMDILLGGGGILNTVNLVARATEDDLIAETGRRLRRMMVHGTTTVEIKSGYGLDTANELKMLRSIRRLREVSPVDTVASFLGAHAIPMAYKGRTAEYVDLICNEMLPAVARDRLAEFCDVFCEEHVFSLKDSRRILEKARDLGLRPKIHADELKPLGGAQLACELGAQSADHLLTVTPTAIDRLSSCDTVGILLPGTAFSLMAGSYAPARGMIDKGVAVALATDCNPGSCYTESMQIVLSLACVMMRMTPAEALNAATINGAFAVGRADAVGSLEKGKQADLLVLDVPDYKYIPYHFGVNHVQTVIKRGEVVVDRRDDPSYEGPFPRRASPTA
jgi:imidazolonepropionase